MSRHIRAGLNFIATTAINAPASTPMMR